MASRDFILSAAQVVPPYSITIGGSTYRWATMEELRDWFTAMPDLSRLDMEVLLRWALSVLWAASGQQQVVFRAMLLGLVGHTLRYTEPTIEDAGIR